MDTTEAEAAQIFTLMQEGYSQRAVPRPASVHISQSCVSKVYKHFLETGAFISRPRPGSRRARVKEEWSFYRDNLPPKSPFDWCRCRTGAPQYSWVAASEWTIRRRIKQANLTPEKMYHKTETNVRSPTSTPSICSLPSWFGGWAMEPSPDLRRVQNVFARQRTKRSGLQAAWRVMLLHWDSG